MTSPVLVGVGGTGQTVIASYLRLSQMAGFRPAPFYVIDSDTEGPLGQRLAHLRREIESSSDNGLRQMDDAQIMPLRWLIDPFPTKNVDRRTFGSLFGNLVGEQRRLFDCLYSPDAEATPIRTGMYGRPAIGATCIRHKILQDDVDLKEFKQALQGGTKHVILVGSCFGGTGSGGVPMLAEELAELSRQPGYSLRVDALIFLPWFRLVQPAGDMVAGDRNLHDHLNEHFEPNAAAGIYYFRETLRQNVHSLILLGVPDRGQVTRISNESSQGETAHALNVLAALLVQNHFAGKLNPPRGISGYWAEDSKLLPKSLEVHRNGKGSSLSLLQVIHRAFVRQDWFGILAVLLGNFSKLPESQRPLFITAGLDRARGTTGSLEQALERASAHLEELQGAAQEHVAWIEKMADEGFFPVGPQDKRPDSPDYDAFREDPLTTVSTWAKEHNPLKKLEPTDYKTPEAFAEAFSGEFLDHLVDRFKL